MERLEAAMAKARAARWTARNDRAAPDPVAPRRSAAPAAAPVPETADWSALRNIEISARRARRQRISALMGPEQAAPYDVLRARVLHRMKTEGWTRMVVTSPNKACGKSTISLNLALSLARQPELRVLLMDFDLRRPRLAALLGETGRTSIAPLLEDRTDLADHAVRFGRNLAICTGGSNVRNSAELLQSSTAAEALDRIEAQWKPDVILFDMPPMQGNDDTLGFLNRVDCALLVAAAGSTSLAQVDISEQELAGLTNVIGTVLNKCRYLDRDTGYDGAYY